MATTAAALLALALAGCRDRATPTDEPVAELEKIPITTFSGKARELYLEGRRLTDRLRFAEGRERFEQALENDPTFALAHLALANSAASRQRFFDSLAAAVVHADRTSDGERQMILARDAGVRGDPAAQRDHLESLVELYPGDERGHALLAGFHGARQEFETAIEHYRQAIAINPDYSPAYNSLGYALRALGRYEEAEEAFLKYVELIPDEPNPYDSYAELLMKIGRFEESIATYRKALAIDPGFSFSHVGIGNNQLFLGDPQAARATFDELYEIAGNDGVRRTARFWTAVSHLHEADHDAARSAFEAMAALAEATGDAAAMSGDWVLIGEVELDRGAPEAARAAFAHALALMEGAEVNADVKEGARRNALWLEARADLVAGDLDAARERAGEYRVRVAERRVAFELRRADELEGALALAADEPESAIESLERAGRQSSRVLYLLARAHAAASHETEALALARQVVDFNQLSLTLALVRDEAAALVDELTAAGV